MLKKQEKPKDKKDDDDPPGAGNTEASPGTKKKVKGHGRNGHSEYTGAERQYEKHPELKHGDPCPECPKGKVYEMKEPETVIRIRSTAPLQAGFAVPLPASTQWEVAERTADRIYPAYDELLRQCAQAEILYNDDTPMKILELMKENRQQKP